MEIKISKMKKGTLCMIIILAFYGMGCFSPSSQNTKVCDKFISLMNISVDEFEREFSDMYMNETGFDFFGDSIIGDYREYYGDWNFYLWERGDSYDGSLYIFPEVDALKMELRGDDNGLRLKNVFIDCGFRFIKTDSNRFDLYKKDSTSLEILRKEGGSLVQAHYYFRIYRNE